MKSHENGSQLYRVAKEICKVLKVNVEKCQYIGKGTRTFFAQQAVKENDFDGCCYDLLSFILVVST